MHMAGRDAWGVFRDGLIFAGMAVCSGLGCGPSGPSPYGGTLSGFASGTAAGGTGASVPVEPDGGISQPMVVIVDTDRTLTASPGQGVGVFSEYGAGGHWHIWWTCDSIVSGTNDPCYFQVSATVSGTATLANAVGENLALSDQLVQTPQEVSATTLTSTNVEGMHFDTAPGQQILLTVQLNGVQSGKFLFFVQDGIVNGGYAGPLTDPLVLSPASP
jgi:hypothetical protein